MGSSQGSLGGLSYSLFEPNKSCKSHSIHTNIVTRSGNKTLLTRKTAEDYLAITYSYENVFAREYRQVEHFVDSVGQGNLNSFHVIDFSRGRNITAVDSTTWTISIADTKDFSATTNLKAHYGAAWDGFDFRVASVQTIVVNTSVRFDITNLFGDLTSTTARNSGIVYPVYECYLIEPDMSGFKSSDIYIPEISSNRGYLYSGELNFCSRYRV